jgi:acyl transferase domain-containing protein/thioesterase domain-containing protein/2-polyprenyl-6-methoxyphenol hydroxylase-like FAD-dependent oxidoreductase/SAM-dependent methyltransferase
VLYGDRDKLRRTLIDPPAARPTSIPASSGDLSEAAAIDYFRRQLSIPLKLAAERIDPDQSFEEYGIDSVMVLEVTAQLERDWGPLPKTLFFEHANLRALARHFTTAFPDRLHALTSGTPAPAAPATVVVPSTRFTPAPSTASPLDIAIVGLAGRYPKAPDLDAFWNNVRDGVDCITEIPRDRWDHDRYYDPHKNADGKVRSKWGGFLDDVDKFDPYFFKISPLEAAVMDPQERLFLETAWQAFEDAGYRRDMETRRNVGVYVGLMYSEYQLFGAAEQAQGRPVALSGSPASVANRVSYLLNLRGPSLTVDSMCSSSLTAIHLACQSLRSGDIEMALAGGVNLSIHPNKYLLLGQGQFVSSQGRCESFGAGGDGYVPGEGVGCVLLKPLAKAVADGDHIYGVIKATALNHGGKTNGYTVPNPSAQQEVIEAALRQAGIAPRAVSYVEAHGTGTLLGDPIEIEGLTKAFRAATADRGFCAIGSVKSNIGHAESAAGIAGLTKVLLQMKHGQLAPSLHSEVRNPHIDFEQTPFVIQQSLAPWTGPRIAGLSSFGAGGSNAHVLIESWEAPQRRAVDRPVVIVLSAKSEEQLRQSARNLRDHLSREHDISLLSVAYTLQVGREPMERRLAFVAASIPEVIAKLDSAPVEHTSHHDLQAAADLWRSGGVPDWDRLYPDGVPPRVSLPTYPFAKERCWFRDDDGPRVVEHRLTGHEEWLRGHRVHGEVMLPAVAYLDLVLQAARPLAHARRLTLSDIVWIPPLIAPQTLRLTLTRRQDGFDFEAASDAGAHARGSIALTQPADERIDLDAFRTAPLDREAFYARFAVAGIEYGASYKNIRELWTGTDHCLARVESDAPTHAAPLLDAALQCVGAIAQTSGAQTPLPFSLALADLPAELPASFYVLAQTTRASRYDIRFVAPDGRVLGRLDGFELRAAADPLSGLTYTVEWRPEPSPETQAVIGKPGEALVIGAEHAFGLERSIADVRGRRVYFLGGLDDGPPAPLDPVRLEEGHRAGPLAWFRAAKDLLGPERDLDVVVLTQQCQQTPGTDFVEPASAGLHGLCQSLSAECPGWSITVVDVDRALLQDSARHAGLLARIGREPHRQGFACVAYRGAARYVPRIVPMAVPATLAQGAIREGGTYVIAGGAGGLGLAVTELLAKRYRARVVWLGRRPLDAAVSDSLDAVARYGPRPLYIQSDITRHDDMRDALQRVQRECGAIHGVIHSALVLHDRALGNMTEAEFEAAAQIKVRGSIALAETFGRAAEDWFCFFSSAQSLMGGPGQANYAAGSSFADSYAEALRGRLACAVHVIDWGYWGEVGAVANPQHRDRMERHGVGSIGAAEGLQAFLRSLAANIGRLVVCRMSAELQQRLGWSANHFAISTYDAIDGLARRGLALALDRLGPRPAVLPKYARLWETLRQWPAAPPTTDAALDAAFAALRDGAPAFAAQIDLLRSCVAALPDVLTGRRTAEDILFSRASLSNVAGVYAGNPVSDYFNQRVAEAVETDCAERLSTADKVRILEVGAGTGSTTAFVLDRLARFGGRVEYVYSDVSTVFLDHGKQRFHTTPAALSFARVDVEHDCSAAGPFDIVIAANVLHATARIQSTLANIKRALTPDGVLVFDELSAARPFLTLTFGLTSGWWSFQDPELRVPGSPGVSIDNWKRLLSEAGFDSTVLTPESAAFGRFVVTARRTGAIAPTATTGIDWLKQLVASTLKMPTARIAAGARFESLGVDSILAVVLSDRLEEAFGPLPRTLVFEYQTIEQLTQYFATHHAARLRELTGAAEPPAPAPLPTAAPIVSRTASTDDIAIIGVSGRYPGADRLSAFWNNLRDGVDSIREIPADRWDAAAFYDPQPAAGKARSKWGGFIDDADKFDPLFFRIAPAEAELLDPQERLFLETVWQTVESAGYSRRRLAALQHETGRGIGVFVGAMYQLYPWVAQRPVTSAVSYWSIANRISYFFDFHGPSIAIDTACSSSMVAIHMACESLRRGEAVCAIAGGVNLTLHPLKYLALQGTGMLGSEKASRCLGQGDGFVPGEGVGAVLLKPLSLAERDRDRILGVIKGSRVHHSGQGNGYRAPDPNTQAESIARLLHDSGVDPDTIGYVEVAANGIPLGDAIEIAALTKAFQRSTARRQFCPIGSVKSNIGHLEAASGISQLTKVLLQLDHGELAPTLYAEPLNPGLALEATPFYVQSSPSEWRRSGDRPRRALINSIGAGGTNAHLIVEEHAAAETHRPATAGPVVVVLSARDEARLRELARNLRSFLDETPDVRLDDLAYTLQVGRDAMEERAAIVVSSLQELSRRLGALASGASDDAIFRGNTESAHAAAALVDGAAGKAFLDALLRARDLTKLARLWIAGIEVDWALAYPDATPDRIELPAYPFERRRCWVSAETAAPAPIASDAGVLDTLKSIVAAVLKVDARELADDRALSLYGVDSILSTVVMDAVRDRFGPALSLAAILEFPTLRALARYVAGTTATASHSPAAGYPAELIPIQPSGAGPASFWVHGLVGFAHLYKRLAFGLGAHYPVYGLQARGVDGRQPPFATVESMAAHYVDCVRKAQPEGPYFLGGYSSGGVVALEMARQLAAAGQRVGRVFLLDTYPLNDDTTRAMEANMDYAMRAVMTANLFLSGEENAAAHIRREELAGVVPDQHVTRLLQLIEARGKTRLPSDRIYRMLRGSIDVANATGAAFKTYTPPVYDASDVVYFQATAKFIDEGNVLGLPVTELDAGNREQAWRERIKGRLEVVNLSCDHFGLLEEPAIRVVCRHIAERLAAGERPQAPVIVQPERGASEAIVVGGGIAGLLAARTLAGHFERVTLLERDPLSGGPSPRRGIPQGNHLHSLLKGGLNVLCDFFPGFDRDLEEHGSVAFQAGFDLLQEDELGVWPQRDFGIRQYCQSRPLLEWCIRQRLFRVPNVRVEDDVDAKELLWSADGARVLGIRVKDRDGRISDRYAALTVNATGRRQTMLHELAEKGWAAPEETRIPVDLGYSTCVFDVPADAARTWKGVFSYSSGAGENGSRRGGSILPIEQNRWIVTLGGRHGEYPPTDLQGFLEYARHLPTPTLYDAIRHARPVTGVAEHFRVPASVLRHFDRLRAVPQRLLHVGDVICAFDPVFGQGMASAALQIMALGDLLAERKLEGIEQAFFRQAARVVKTPWHLAAKSHFESAPGDAGLATEYEQFLALSRRAMEDANVHRVLIEVFHLVKLYDELRAAATKAAVAGD